MSQGSFNILIAFACIALIVFLIWKAQQRKIGSKSTTSPPERFKAQSEDQQEVVFGKEFKFVICDDEAEADENEWYRLERWKSPNFIKMKTSWGDDWIAFPPEVPVMGINKEPQRAIDFLMMADRPDFRVFLEREPSNPHDSNAVKVMASAKVDGEQRIRHLGYLPRDVAEMMKNEKELDARPHCAYLSYEGKDLDFRIRVLAGR